MTIENETKKYVEEGDSCNQPGCNGIMEFHFPVKGCSCHISPPCSACMEHPLTCSECGEEISP